MNICSYVCGAEIPVGHGELKYSSPEDEDRLHGASSEPDHTATWGSNGKRLPSKSVSGAAVDTDATARSGSPPRESAYAWMGAILSAGHSCFTSAFRWLAGKFAKAVPPAPGTGVPRIAHEAISNGPCSASGNADRTALKAAAAQNDEASELHHKRNTHGDADESGAVVSRSGHKSGRHKGKALRLPAGDRSDGPDENAPEWKDMERLVEQEMKKKAAKEEMDLQISLQLQDELAVTHAINLSGGLRSQFEIYEQLAQRRTEDNKTGMSTTMTGTEQGMICSSQDQMIEHDGKLIPRSGIELRKERSLDPCKTRYAFDAVLYSMKSNTELKDYIDRDADVISTEYQLPREYKPSFHSLPKSDQAKQWFKDHGCEVIPNSGLEHNCLIISLLQHAKDVYSEDFLKDELRYKEQLTDEAKELRHWLFNIARSFPEYSQQMSKIDQKLHFDNALAKLLLKEINFKYRCNMAPVLLSHHYDAEGNTKGIYIAGRLGNWGDWDCRGVRGDAVVILQTKDHFEAVIKADN